METCNFDHEMVVYDDTKGRCPVCKKQAIIEEMQIELDKLEEQINELKEMV